MLGSVRLVFAAATLLGAGSVLAIMYLLLKLHSAARRLQDLPFNARVNPLNILAYRRLWTPEIERLNRHLNVAGLAFLVCVAVVLVLGVLM